MSADERHLEWGMNASEKAIYRVEVFNTAVASENRIHDDETARRFGFRGGLVPGVEVYAYMAHMPVERFGEAWLERGGMECRFFKPVYDGDVATISVTAEDSDGLSISVESDGELCAKGKAWLRARGARSPAPSEAHAATPPAQRPEANEASLAPGRTLGIEPVVIDAGMLAQYLSDIREKEPIYARAKLVHPGQILRLANVALLQNVKLGPWIHVGSRVENFGRARLHDHLSLQARIASNYMHKGHAMVELDAEVLANRCSVIAQIRHLAIWRPRQIGELANAASSGSSKPN
jgi:hypothetical protein